MDKGCKLPMVGYSLFLWLKCVINGEMCVTKAKEYSTDPIAGTYNAYSVSAFEGELGQ